MRHPAQPPVSLQSSYLPNGLRENEQNERRWQKDDWTACKGPEEKCREEINKTCRTCSVPGISVLIKSEHGKEWLVPV